MIMIQVRMVVVQLVKSNLIIYFEDELRELPDVLDV